MTRLPRLSGNELGAMIKRFGFEHSHTTGSHMMFKHPDGRRVTIPAHGNEEIGPGLLLKIIRKDLKTTREEFEKML